MAPRLPDVPSRALVVAATHHARTVITAGALTLVLGLAVVQALPGGSAVTPRSLGSGVSDVSTAGARTPAADRTEAVLRRHGCTTTGFDDATPRSAIVRGEDGDLRLVDFDRGYASFTGEAPGDLLAVCLAAPR